MSPQLTARDEDARVKFGDVIDALVGRQGNIYYDEEEQQAVAIEVAVEGPAGRRHAVVYVREAQAFVVLNALVAKLSVRPTGELLIALSGLESGESWIDV